MRNPVRSLRTSRIGRLHVSEITRLNRKQSRYRRARIYEWLSRIGHDHGSTARVLGGVMKLIGATIIAVAFCAASASAQTSETTSKTKIKIKDGKEVSVTG